MKKAVIGFFVGILVFYILSGNSSSNNMQVQTNDPNIEYYSKDKDDSKDISEYEKYCADSLANNVGSQYEVFGKSLYVKKDIGADTRTYGNDKINNGEKVVLKSIVKNKYVQIENKDGNSFYESITTFYENTNKADDLSIKKGLKKLRYDALGHNTMRMYIAYIMLAFAFILTIRKAIEILDNTRFKKQREDKKIADNGLFKIIPGAMLAAIITFVRLISEDKMVYYFMNNNISLFKRALTIEKMVLLLLLAINVYLLWLNLKECFTVFIFGHAVGSMGFIVTLNLLSFYICYALHFVGMAIYALVVIIQCTFYGLELPKKESSEKTENKSA